MGVGKHSCPLSPIMFVKLIDALESRVGRATGQQQTLHFVQEQLQTLF